MISKERALHMLGVARECYKLAKEKGMSEDDCRLAFLIGWNHDIGYEFGSNETHQKVGGDILNTLRNGELMFARYAIENHGKLYTMDSILLRILNRADMTINEKGEKVTVDDRIFSIGSRYGFNSKEYNDAHKLASLLFNDFD